MQKYRVPRVLLPFPPCGHMNNKLVIVLIAGLFGGAYVAGHWLQPTAVEDKPANREMRYESCNPAVNDCISFINDHKLVVKFLQQPSALKPFTVAVFVDNIKPDTVYVEFAMRGMDMGLNRFPLEYTAEHTWTSDVILPICSLGRKDWVSQLQVVYQGHTWFADFNFEQTGN